MVTMPNAGDLLIAPPLIPDRRFAKSVMLVTTDSNGATFALALNKPTHHTLQDAVMDTGMPTNLNFPLYWGGPVNPGTVWMLHSPEWATETTVAVNDMWSLTSNVEMFSHLADGDYPKHFRLMLGYAGWAPGQLKAELRGLPPWNHNHSWLVADSPSPGWVYEQPVEELWLNSMELSSHQAIDAWL